MLSLPLVVSVMFLKVVLNRAVRLKGLKQGVKPMFTVGHVSIMAAS